MWQNVKPILASLFGSKKFLAMLAGVLVWLASKAGVGLSESDVMPLLLLIGGYVGAQGLADIGKEAKKVEADTLLKVRAEEAGKTTGGKS